MKKLYINIFITIFLFANVVLLKINNDPNYQHKCYIYNEKGQLFADTSIVADTNLKYLYSNEGRVNEFYIYSKILNLIVYNEYCIESGIQGKIVFKFDFQIDSIAPQYSIIKGISVVKTKKRSNSNDEIFLEMIREHLLNRKFFTNRYIESFYLHVPIKFKIDSSDKPKYPIPYVHKSIENGYLVVERNAIVLINYDK